PPGSLEHVELGRERIEHISHPALRCGRAFVPPRPAWARRSRCYPLSCHRAPSAMSHTFPSHPLQYVDKLARQLCTRLTCPRFVRTRNVRSNPRRPPAAQLTTMWCCLSPHRHVPPPARRSRVRLDRTIRIAAATELAGVGHSEDLERRPIAAA